MKISTSVILSFFILSGVSLAADMKTYYPNGKVQTEITSSFIKTYYENGQLSSLVNQKDGVPNGLNVRYYENGQKMSEAEFKDGNPVGMFKQYYESGKVMQTRISILKRSRLEIMKCH